MRQLTRIFAMGLLLNLFSFTVSAQSFEGVIEFKKQTNMDTTFYIYYVKGDQVRIDEIGSRSKKADGSFLLNLKDKKMIVVNHDRKMFMNQNQSSPPVVNGTPEVTKTKNTTTMFGYKCSEYVVKNTADNTEISYMVAPGKFDFFDKLLPILNRKDKSSVYYMQLKDVGGMFPFLAIEKTIGGPEKTRLEVTRVDKKALDISMFEVPKGYTQFDKDKK